MMKYIDTFVINVLVVTGILGYMTLSMGVFAVATR